MSKINHRKMDPIDITRGPILASTSPFRRQLLDNLQIPFDTASPEIDESPLESEQPIDLVKRLAFAKAMAIGTAHSNRVVIGSDQIAVFENKILGKPGDKSTACAQLTAFSGNQVLFLTSVTVCARAGRSVWNHTDSTTVTFRHLGTNEIDRYLDAEEPYNCAGGFKSEKLGISLFDKIDSEDPSALIGLPMIFVCKALRHYGMLVP